MDLNLAEEAKPITATRNSTGIDACNSESNRTRNPVEQGRSGVDGKKSNFKKKNEKLKGSENGKGGIKRKKEGKTVQ